MEYPVLRSGRLELRRREAGIDFRLGRLDSPTPSLHVLAVESAGDLSLLPDLVNVVDLLDGKTAIVTSFSYDDGGSLDLYEYRDGLDLHSMPHLQSIAAGEWVI